MKAKRLSKTRRVRKAKRVSKAQRLTLDIITTLPQPIIETILCLLPIKEAARMSILSREWRYKWTTIPKLDFSLKDRWQMMEINKLLCVVHRVVLLHQDPIHEFTLTIDNVDNSVKFDYRSCEIDEILLHLSRNHMVKKLKLLFCDSRNGLYSLPLSFFSLHHLMELDIHFCDIIHQPIFNGFGSLTSLSLLYVRLSIKTLLHLLSNCPSLKSLNLLLFVEDILVDEKSTMIELFECLPVIEHLTIGGDITDIIRWFVQDLVPQELPTSLIHLKYFRFEHMSFHDGYGLTFLAVLIKNSPNLEKIELEIDTDHYLFREIDDDPDLYEEYHSDVWLEHLSDVWLEHLTEFKFESFSNLEPELEFVKFILARSPKLKKVHIRSEVQKDKKPRMLVSLLLIPRVSGVEIDVV